jgi:hypothetical protein
MYATFFEARTGSPRALTPTFYHGSTIATLWRYSSGSARMAAKAASESITFSSGAAIPHSKHYLVREAVATRERRRRLAIREEVAEQRLEGLRARRVPPEDARRAAPVGEAVRCATAETVFHATPTRCSEARTQILRQTSASGVARRPAGRPHRVGDATEAAPQPSAAYAVDSGRVRSTHLGRMT